MSGAFDFEGRQVPIRDADSVASALYRDGVRTFNRSLKSHRRRGLYCMTGDCPNCLVNVDGMPAVRSCCTPARAGMTVKRETGWPSTDADVLAINDHLHALMPVGFYYKAFIKPRFSWPIFEKLVRKLGLSDHVTLAGQVPFGTLVDEYAACDVFCLPSL